MRSKAGVFLTVGVLVAGIGSSAELPARRAQEQAASVAALGGGLTFTIAIPHERAVLAVSGPTGLVFDKEFVSGTAPAFNPANEVGMMLRDGRYNYALRIMQAAGAPRTSAQTEDQPRAGKAERMFVRRGSFVIRGGAIVLDDDESARRREEVAR